MDKTLQVDSAQISMFDWEQLSLPIWLVFVSTDYFISLSRPPANGFWHLISTSWDVRNLDGALVHKIFEDRKVQGTIIDTSE